MRILKDARQLTYGAILLAIFAVLLWLTTYVPIIGAVTTFFLALPFVLFSYRNNITNIAVFFVGSVILSVIFGTILALPATLIFGVPGLVMGYLLQLGKNRGMVLFGSMMVCLMSIVMMYVLSFVLLEDDIVETSIELTMKSIDTTEKVMESLGQNPTQQLELLRQGLELAPSLKPTLFVFAAFFIVLVIQAVCLPIAKRFQVKVTDWTPFRDFQLPKSLLWVYLGALVLSLAVNPEKGTFMYLAIINIAFLLQWLFVLQGLAVIHYVCYLRGIAKSVPILLTVGTLVFPLLLYIVRILGIIDLGFDLRQRFKSQK